jgi:hypothetical protein
MKRVLSVKEKTDFRTMGSLKAAYRRGFSKRLALGLILLAAFIVLTGDFLYGEGSDDALFIDEKGKVKVQELEVKGKVGIGTDNPTSRLHVEGEVLINGNIKASGIEVSGEIKDKTGYLMPAGGIIMYTGSIADFDKTGKGKIGTKVQGWALCNGKNSTPDLRDRFVVGAGGAFYPVNARGGEDKHKLSGAEMPRHQHKYSRAKWNTMQWKGGRRDPFWTDNGRDRYETANSDFAGKSLPHENRPPYHAVFFIMKLRD